MVLQAAGHKSREEEKKPNYAATICILVQIQGDECYGHVRRRLTAKSLAENTGEVARAGSVPEQMAVGVLRRWRSGQGMAQLHFFSAPRGWEP